MSIFGSPHVCLILALTMWASQSLAANCPDGQSASIDTHGHCCFPEQVWSHARNACIGTPKCPSGFDASGETCVAQPKVACPPGQSISDETAGHCCYGRQAWSTIRKLCVGVPACPPGLEVSGESCVAPADPYQMLAPLPSRAPACPSGQTITDETEGHCCWPDQLWSTTGSTCVGVPRCPVGLVVRGETCAPEQALPSPPPPPIVVAPPPRFAVAFTAAQGGDRYQVTVGDLSCVTPCTLELAPGRARVHVQGSAVAWDEQVSIPSLPSTVRLAHGSRIGLVLGPALLLLGAADVAIGGYLFSLSGPFRQHGIAGLVCVLSGAVGLGVGIAEWVLAARHRVELSGAAPPSSAVRFTGAGLAPLPSGGLATGASFAFY